MRIVAIIVVVFALGFAAGYVVARPPSSAKPCVNALKGKTTNASLSEQCRKALDRAVP